MTDDRRVFEFKALDINHEHWTMAAVPCGCGGRWEKGAQRLVTGDDGPVDEWDVVCATCGQRSVFRFDVSAFFAHKLRVQEWLATLLPNADERLRGRLARKIGPEFGVKFRTWFEGLRRTATRQRSCTCTGRSSRRWRRCGSVRTPSGHSDALPSTSG